VKSLVIFLNELSFNSNEPTPPETMLRVVLSTLATIRAARKIKNDLVVAGHVSLVNISFNNGTHSLTSLLGGNDYKEEWRSLQSLTQSSPWEVYPRLTSPEKTQEVNYRGESAIGMLWAKQNESTILSFALPPNWADDHVNASYLEIDNVSKNLTSSEITIPNLSEPEHVKIHRNLISNYGRIISPSSLVYEGDGFVVRMYFDDHPPPHFHVLKRRDTSETLAKYTIETLDPLLGGLTSVMRRQVIGWAERHRNELTQCWELCRTGNHPIRVEGD